MRRKQAAAALLVCAVLAGIGGRAAAEARAAERAEMIATVVAHARSTAHHTGRPTLDPRILRAMAALPRDAFLPAPLAPLAYLDRPLPVGHGQTVSQPFIVGLMTDCAEVGPGDDVLLLGIGGGYHAALLAELAATVRAVDIQPEVAAAAMNRLIHLGYDNVFIANHDPYFGWRVDLRRFDAIIVRQAIDFMPDGLVGQLAPGGRIVAPIGGAEAGQTLVLGRKTRDGRLVEQSILPVRFTRLPGGRRL